LLPSLDCQDIRGNGFAIEEFLPLVSQYAPGRAQCRFDESHGLPPLSCTATIFLISLIAALGAMSRMKRSPLLAAAASGIVMAVGSLHGVPISPVALSHVAEGAKLLQVAADVRTIRRALQQPAGHRRHLGAGDRVFRPEGAVRVA